MGSSDGSNQDNKSNNNNNSNNAGGGGDGSKSNNNNNNNKSKRGGLSSSSSSVSTAKRSGSSSSWIPDGLTLLDGSLMFWFFVFAITSWIFEPYVTFAIDISSFKGDALKCHYQTLFNTTSLRELEDNTIRCLGKK